jgi:uncharacterized protein YjbI with pentapeptide repeats
LYLETTIITFNFGIFDSYKENLMGGAGLRRIALAVLCLYTLTPVSMSRTNVQLAGAEHPNSTESSKRELNKKIQPGQRMDGAMLENEDLTNSMLAGVRFKKAKLKGANFDTAMLAGADLRDADLEYANLKRAMLLGANLSGANLHNTNFEEANLLGASLERARIEGASFKNAFVNQDQINEACGRPRALPQGIKIPKPC